MTYLLCRLDCQPDNVTENDNPPLPHGVPSARTVLFPQTIGKPPIKGKKHKKHTNPILQSRQANTRSPFIGHDGNHSC